MRVRPQLIRSFVAATHLYDRRTDSRKVPGEGRFLLDPSLPVYPGVSNSCTPRGGPLHRKLKTPRAGFPVHLEGP